MTRELDLGGTWQIQPVTHFDGNYGDRWLAASVPGHWQQVPGLERHTGKVVYRRHFDLSPQLGRRYFLRINGAFYWSIAYLNGVRLGANAGYFFPVEYEIGDLLRDRNELLIELDCPDEPDQTRQRRIGGLFRQGDGLDPAANPGGLWLPVEIISTGPARLIDPCFRTIVLTGNNASARVSGRVTIDTVEPARLTVRIAFVPRNFEGPTVTFERRVHKSAGVHLFQYDLDVPEPRLWWTHDHGRPDLYTLRLEVIADDGQSSDVFETPFGIRTLDRRGHACSLNGRRLYLRGANYPPDYTRLATITRERIDQDLRLARECNLNFLRVHAHIDHPLFYEAADEAGILLWQDFPGPGSYRPESEAQALRQLERTIVLLGNHPSIAAWRLRHEPIARYDSHLPLNPRAILRFARAMLFPNRDRMDRALARRARFLDPHRLVAGCSDERGLFKKSIDDIDRRRARKYQPGGGLAAFLLFDSKSSCEEMKQAMSPVAAFALLDRRSYPRNAIARIPVYAVNDKWEPVEVKVRLRVVSPVGDTILDKTYTDALPADSMALMLAAPKIKLRWEGEYRLALELEGPDGVLRREYQIKVR